MKKRACIVASALLVALGACSAPARHASASTPIASSEVTFDCPVTFARQTERDVSGQPVPLAATFTLRHYRIRGSSLQDLRHAMHQCMPNDQDGTADARTMWYVSWHVWWEPDRHGCAVTRTAVHVQVDMYFPQWVDGSNPKVARTWNRLMAGLMTHENGHKHNALDAGDSVARALLHMRAGTCDELFANAHHRFDEIMKSFNDKDADYDKRTHHGETQIRAFRSRGSSVRNACNRRADL